MSWVVGVDAGGTRTRAVVVDEEGRELARAEGGAALADPHAPEQAAETIAAVSRDAADRAGVPLPCAALWAGVAGVGRETTRSGVEQALARMGLAERVRVSTDVEAAAADAFGSGPGILLVSGTGSIGWGRAEDGTLGRVGGWGSLIGDEGSGYAIGLEALRRIARTVDGRGPGTELQTAVIQSLGLEDAQDLIQWAAEADKGAVAALVPVVAQASRAGDAVAGEILVMAVEDLEGHVLTLLDTLGPWTEPPRLALCGGLLDPGRPLRRAMESALAGLHVRLVGRPLFPALGAATLARELAEGAPHTLSRTPERDG